MACCATGDEGLMRLFRCSQTKGRLRRHRQTPRSRAQTRSASRQSRGSSTCLRRTSFLSPPLFLLYLAKPSSPQISSALINSGISQSQIGVIAPYRQQIKLLNRHFAALYPDVEILTADKSQGRDKDCIVMSLVRSNDDGQVRFRSSSYPRFVRYLLTKGCNLDRSATSSKIGDD